MALSCFSTTPDPAMLGCSHCHFGSAEAPAMPSVPILPPTHLGRHPSEEQQLLSGAAWSQRPLPLLRVTELVSLLLPQHPV